MVRWALQTMMVLGLTASASQAQQQQPVVVNVNFVQPYMPPNVPPTAPTNTELGNFMPPPQMPPPSRANQLNLACYTNRNSPGCTNLRSELRWIFGTCRDFFGEPCLPHPNATGQGFFGMQGNGVNVFRKGEVNSIFGGCSGCGR